MTYAYNEYYLEDGMNNLGESFEYACKDCGLSLDEYMNLFISSGYAAQFEKANPKVICGRSGSELAMEILSKTNRLAKFPEPSVSYERSPEFWCGWVIAYYQWKENKSFKEISSKLPTRKVLAMYKTMHETSVDNFVIKVNKMISKLQKESKLQIQRKLCGLSQSQLAKKSNVNLRTLQQYEIGSKDLRKASYQTIFDLTNALGCKPEDIM